MASKLQTLVAKRQSLRAQANIFYSKYAELSTQMKAVDGEIKEELTKLGTKKYETLDKKYLVTIKDNSPTFEIVDEHKLGYWLRAQKEQRGIDTSMFFGIKKEVFTPFARTVLKETGEIPDGAQVNQSQSLLVTERKDDKKDG